MSRNVPDDWDYYWTHCSICGSRYHLSEGGCSCTDDLDYCHCQSNDWHEHRGRIVCSSCGGEPGEDLTACFLCGEPLDESDSRVETYYEWDEGDGEVAGDMVTLCLDCATAHVRGAT